MSPAERSDPKVASAVFDLLLGDLPDEDARSVIEFFAASIDYLQTHRPRFWSVTMFDEVIRLNGGWVESLVLHRGGLRVLAQREAVPFGVPFEPEEEPYKMAPGCRMVGVAWSAIAETLKGLSEAHLAALAITAQREPMPVAQSAHSPGVVLFVSSPEQVVRRFGAFDEISAKLFSEGARIAVLVNRYERDWQARATCIAHHGTRCSICGMSFLDRYGESMTDFIHVHHLVPLSEIGENYEVDPVNDLAPVCPNCHAFLHHRKPPLTLVEARTALRVRSL
jgi:5-methylcytosine-specific restriction protein A